MVTIIIDEGTAKGKALLDFARKLRANKKEISVVKRGKGIKTKVAKPAKSVKPVMPVSEALSAERLTKTDAGKSLTIEQILVNLNEKYKGKRNETNGN